jgi:hypothetical protein
MEKMKNEDNRKELTIFNLIEEKKFDFMAGSEAL